MEDCCVDVRGLVCSWVDFIGYLQEQSGSAQIIKFGFGMGCGFLCISGLSIKVWFL